MAKLSIKWKIEIIITLLIIICALLGLLVNDKVETYEFKESATYFLNGINYSISEGDKVKIEEEQNIISRQDGTELVANGLPVYINNADAILLINDMAYFKPDGEYLDSYKLTCFSRVEHLNGSGAMEIEWETKKDIIKSGFLFDGKDTYVLIDNCYLEYNGRTIELSPLSYVIVYRSSYIEYYEAGTGKYELEMLETNVKITSKERAYKIVADLDFVETGNKTYMLQSNVSNYSSYFTKEAD